MHVTSLPAIDKKPAIEPPTPPVPMIRYFVIANLKKTLKINTTKKQNHNLI